MFIGIPNRQINVKPNNQPNEDIYPVFMAIQPELPLTTKNRKVQRKT